MFTVKPLLSVATLLTVLSGCSQTVEQNETTATAESAATAKGATTYARFVPERLDDFAWENDLVAFRAYGPAARAGSENSGVDCWLKRVNYPIIDLWYKRATEQKISYHKDHGEGLDNYHVGSSAGCGDAALWLDGQRQPLETYTHWEIIKQEKQQTKFNLFYELAIAGDTYKKTKTVSIELGKRLFSVEETFWKNDQLMINQPIAIGVATHDGKGQATFNPEAGFISVWENIGGDNLGTGIKLAADTITAQKLINEPDVKDDGHALYLVNTNEEGKVFYNVGYGWSKAGEITTEQQWLEYLENF